MLRHQLEKFAKVRQVDGNINSCVNLYDYINSIKPLNQIVCAIFS